MLRKIIYCFLVLSTFSTFAKVPTEQTQTLSLQETILLAVRYNPNVQRAQLNHVLQKFALEVARWQFSPHYQLSGVGTHTRTVTNGIGQDTESVSVQPQATWQMPIGTKLKLSTSEDVLNQSNPTVSLQIVQPLMRGFGRAIVESTLYNAIDGEKISRLNVENTLRNTITSVINAYLDVVSAENLVKIDEQALKRATESAEQTKLFIQAGRKAGVEIVTVEADIAHAKTRLENDKNHLDQLRYALLTTIGINPNTKIKFTTLDVPALIKKYYFPSLEETKHLTVENDIQYQVDKITMEGSVKRSVLLAEDNARWQLDLTANHGMSQTNQSQSIQLNLTIPIDDKNAKQSVAVAKAALREATIALRQEKWEKEVNGINGWNRINSAKRALYFAEKAEKLQQQTYQISFQKYAYGLIDSVTLQSVQQQLINSEQSLLDTRVNYLKSLVSLDQQIGKTLATWNIRVRYS